MAKRKPSESEDSPQEINGATTEAGHGPTPEEKAAIFNALLQEIKKMGLPVTPEALTLLLRNRHPEVELTKEDIPVVTEIVKKLQAMPGPGPGPTPTPTGPASAGASTGASAVESSLSTALSLLKSLLQKFGPAELKRIIDVLADNHGQ